jgi:hypothetical protein
LVLWHGREYVRERKGEDEGDAQLKYQKRRGRRSGGRKVAVGGLAIDGQRLGGVKGKRRGRKRQESGGK